MKVYSGQYHLPKLQYLCCFLCVFYRSVRESNFPLNFSLFDIPAEMNPLIWNRMKYYGQELQICIFSLSLRYRFLTKWTSIWNSSPKTLWGIASKMNQIGTLGNHFRYKWAPEVMSRQRYCSHGMWVLLLVFSYPSGARCQNSGYKTPCFFNVFLTKIPTRPYLFVVVFLRKYEIKIMYFYEIGL